MIDSVNKPSKPASVAEPQDEGHVVDEGDYIPTEDMVHKDTDPPKVESDGKGE